MSVMWLFLLFGLCWTSHFKLFYDENVPAIIRPATVIAATNIEYFLNFTTDVNILFQWVPLSSEDIAGASFYSVCQDPNYIYVILPPALYVQKYGNTGSCRSYTEVPFYHVIIQINSGVDFYYDSDPNTIPSNKYDLVSVVMHEIVHGLGMKSDVIDGSGNVGNAPFGLLFDWIVFGNVMESGWPSRYDNIPLSNPAVKNSEMLVSGGLSFPSSPPFLLYTPVKFQYSVSISHTTDYGLMHYKGVRGRNLRTLNVNIVNMLQTLGYSTKNCDNSDVNCGNCVVGSSCFISGVDGIFSFLFSN